MTIENLVQSILNASWGIYLVFIFIFIFMRIPKRKIFAPYRRSRGFMVVAFFFLFSQIFLGWTLPKNTLSAEVLAAFDTPFFYMELIFLCARPFFRNIQTCAIRFVVVVRSMCHLSDISHH